ncbi:MAG TPA: MBL fold metallo-hydrolase [Gemmatimonadales bacterium]|nr:MBL fold metallo-hydrolase [Gemmatimonadales bacterium]
MISLHILGSGSRGNCLAISCGDATLLVDAGFSARETARRAESAGVELGSVIGIAITHEHGDHVAGAPLLARKLGVPILTAGGTWQAIAPRFRGRTHHRSLGLSSAVELGPFTIHAAPASHDAAEPLALAVHCEGGERIGIAYDLGRMTAGVRLLLRELSAVVFESNHDEIRLRTCGYPPSVQERIACSTGHLSNRAAAEALGELCHPGLGTVVLAHLSEKSNDPETALRAVQPALRRARFSGELHVAYQDEPLPAIVVGPAERQLSMGL